MYSINRTGYSKSEKYLTAIFYEIEGKELVTYFENSATNAVEANHISGKIYEEFILSLPKKSKNTSFKTFQFNLSSHI